MFKAILKEPLKVEMSILGHKVITDLPKSMGGQEKGPTPLELMLFALLSCSSSSVFFYLIKHGLSPEGINIALIPYFEGENLIKADININLPPNFPEEKEEALLAFAKHCKVGSYLKFPYKVSIIKGKALA